MIEDRERSNRRRINVRSVSVEGLDGVVGLSREVNRDGNVDPTKVERN